MTDVLTTTLLRQMLLLISGAEGNRTPDFQFTEMISLGYYHERNRLPLTVLLKLLTQS